MQGGEREKHCFPQKLRPLKLWGQKTFACFIHINLFTYGKVRQEQSHLHKAAIKDLSLLSSSHYSIYILFTFVLLYQFKKCSRWNVNFSNAPKVKSKNLIKLMTMNHNNLQNSSLTSLKIWVCTLNTNWILVESSWILQQLLPQVTS